MKLILTLLLSLIVANKAYSADEIKRQQLFTLAYNSLSFILFTAEQDNNFVASLDAEEKQMLSSIYDITADVMVNNWLIKNKVHGFQTKTATTHAYMIKKSQVVYIDRIYNKSVGLQFSDNQSLFTLNPTEPIRSAMTTEDLDSDIFINLNKINAATQTIDLASAMSMLIHEFGHKLAHLKNQQAVNSLAAKFETYVRSMINLTQFDGKKVSTLYFKNFRFMDQWIENILYGEYKGVNIPPEVHPLSVFDGQGVYAWVEDETQVTDLTEALVTEIHKTKLVKFKNLPRQQFVNHNIVLASELTVTQDSNHDIKFAINANLHQLVIPFFTTETVTPDQYHLYENAFEGESYGSSFLNKQIYFDSKNYHLKNTVPFPLTYLKPEIQSQFIEKRNRGKNMELFFKVKGQLKMTVDQYTYQAPLWPELVVQLGDVTTTIKATNYYEDSDEFKFVIINVEALAHVNITVKALQLRLKRENIALKYTDLIVKSFLPGEIKLAQATAATVSTTNLVNPHLKSIRLWNGQSWTSLTAKHQLTSGATLRLVFLTNEYLRDLTLVQKYKTNIERNVNLMGQKSPVYKIQEDHERRIQFEDQYLRQSIKGENLYVDIDVDAPFLNSFSNSDQLLLDNNDGKPYVASPVLEEERIKTDATRSITDIGFTTASGQQKLFPLRTDLSFLKTNSSLPVATDKNRSKKIMCEGLF